MKIYYSPKKTTTEIHVSFTILKFNYTNKILPNYISKSSDIPPVGRKNCLIAKLGKTFEFGQKVEHKKFLIIWLGGQIFIVNQLIIWLGGQLFG